MIKFLKKYQAFIIGLIVIVPIFYLLDCFGVIILPEERTYEIVLYAIFWGVLIALPFHKFNYLKRKKSTVLKVLVLIGLFFIALAIDSFMKLPDNPITFILLMGFWFGVAYVLIPEFIKKYWKLITLIYVPLFLYFVYLRLFSGDLDAYLKIKEDFPFYLFFLPIPIFFLVWLFEQWKWIQNLKTEKTKTEISLLRSQINPHFFFNTLNNLYALTVKNSKQAPEVILKLSDMMRYTIYEGEKETVKILDEIEYLINYIELHKIRYKKSVDITFNYSNVDIDLKVAPLLYIILLENAFKHGVETLSENAFIHINLYNDADFIYFKIENNFDTKEIDKTNGIGLENLKRRLSLLYNQKHDLVIDEVDTVYKAILKISKHA
ncbi:sensor histidine kinase [Xanthomarina sp. GH4-25]|uniref:sensor histidine kinase n=1 Tax=Xanthomarina sp. GH4-25 TaxID=3349335 RepID=UPI003877EFCD